VTTIVVILWHLRSLTTSGSNHRPPRRWPHWDDHQRWMNHHDIGYNCG